MTYYADNPFAPASRRSIARGAYFLGREQDLEEIEGRLIRPEGQRGSLAIIGLPDIGKLCLIDKVLLERKTTLHQRKLVPIKMDLKTYTEPDKPDKFFRDLVSSCCDELEDLNFATPKITEIAAWVLAEWDRRGGTISLLTRFFKNVHRAGIRVIFILDNFDHADSLFKGDTARIHWLRHLTDGDCQVTWVVLACKPISEIETVPNSLSDDMFDVRHLGMFAEDAMITYFSKLARMGVSLSAEHKKMIEARCGRHPYLLSLLGYHLVEDYAQQADTIDVERALRKVQERFIQSYDRIIDLVLASDSHSEKLQTLRQILFGRPDSVEQKDIDKMLDYGLIRLNPAYSAFQKSVQSSYIAFSEHFQQYLYTRLFGNDMPSAVQERSNQIIHGSDPYSWSQTMLPGQRLGEHYTVIELWSTSGHSQVAKAWDARFERYVAIKRMYLDPSCSEETIKNFKGYLKREAKILSQLKHENIGSVYDIVDNPPATVMEWIEGESLDRIWEKGAGLSAIEVVRLGIKLTGALVYLHTREQPIIHRDLKPKNIIVRDNGEPVLIDFDIARASAAVGTIIPYDEHGQTSAVAGTEGYGAPEQFLSPGMVTGRADIYALGVVLYETLTRGSKASYQDVPPHTSVPYELYQIIRTMLSEDPAARPDAQQLCSELERYLQKLEE
ncbi:MAG TPA: serine/threonine-protein kinase [Ktedonobacteraceae bacterium]|jgi:hypothetical protein